MNYATKRLAKAARGVADELELWGSDTLETMNLTKVAEDLRDAIFYFDAHGESQKEDRD